jgi:hypothetical protein
MDVDHPAPLARLRLRPRPAPEVGFFSLANDIPFPKSSLPLLVGCALEQCVCVRNFRTAGNVKPRLAAAALVRHALWRPPSLS